MWAPLSNPTFRAIWTANLVSNVGGWMQTAGAGWEMTNLAPSPMFVAAMALATTCPVFLVGFPAGVLADRFDRRNYILCTQAWMMLSAATLTILAFSGRLDAWSLLALTCCMGIGNAANAPAWQTVAPEIVPRDQLPQAIALNSAGFNLARTVGPVVGQGLYGLAGAFALFAVNTCTFLAVIGAMLGWKRNDAARAEQRRESFWEGFRSGLGYVRGERALRAVWIRGACFFVPGIAFLTLLPHFARYEMDVSTGVYGVVFASFGVGAVAGTLLLGTVNRLVGADRANVAAMLVSATAMAVAAWAQSAGIVSVCLAAAGGAWMTVVANNNVAVQSMLPGWVRARAMAVHQMVFFGSLAVGQAGWGLFAEHFGVPATLTTAAALLLPATALAAAIRLPAPRLAPPPDRAA